MRRSGTAVLLSMAVALLVAGCAGGALPSEEETSPASPAVVGAPGASSQTAPATEAPSTVPVPIGPTPTPTPEPLPSGLDPAIVAAVAWRREMGLRTDLAWVIRVTADPTASVSWAHPILAEEEAFIWARQERLKRYVGLVRQHAAEHPDEFGGLFLDNANSRVASLWTANLPGHLAALLELAGDDAPVAVLPARWPERELRSVQDRIPTDLAWFAAFEAAPTGIGADIERNVVSVEVSSANPDAPRLIAERLVRELGIPVEMLDVVSDGTGVELLPSGTVRGVVVMADGSRPGANALLIDGRADTIGSCGGGDVGYGVGADGRFEIPCQVGGYTIEIKAPKPADGEWVVVGQAHVLVGANRVSTVRVRLVPGAVIRG